MALCFVPQGATALYDGRARDVCANTAGHNCITSPRIPAFRVVPRKASTAFPSNAPALRVMMVAKGKKPRNWSPRIDNRIARMRYEFLQVYECGIELVGTEIKSVRHGSMNLRDGYARVKDGELFLYNVHITPWENSSNYFNHEALRPRKLLLHKSDIRKLAGKQVDPGLTVVPTRAYFNQKGYLKVEIALAKGKQLHDRREDIKKREDHRNIERVIKQMGR